MDAASLAGGNTINSSTGEVVWDATWGDTSTITVTATGCQGPKTADHIVLVSENVESPIFVLGDSSSRCIDEETRVFGAESENSTIVTYTLDATSISNGLVFYDSIGAIYFPDGCSGTATITATGEGCGGDQSSTHVITTAERAAVNDKTSLTKNDSVTINVTDNDICDIDSSTVTSISGPDNGTVTISSNGDIKYVPSTDFAGVDTTFTTVFAV